MTGILLSCHMQIHAEWIITTQYKGRAKPSLTKYVPLTLFVRFEKGYSRFACERELETEQNCIILTPILMAVSVVACSFSGAAGWWLSVLHLITNFSGPQLIGGPEGPFGLAWLSLPHLVSITPTPTPTVTIWLLSWLSYIIVQRPLNLWNGMFDRHQAEITVMQFTGHSLPVHHSEVGPSPCPILSAELTCEISSHNCHWNVSLPSGASLWMAFLAGSKVKIQQYQLKFVRSEQSLEAY